MNHLFCRIRSLTETAYCDRTVSPAYVGERIKARVEITRLRVDKDLVNLATALTGDDGRMICRDEALVLVRNLESSARS